jgi:hypothetical protein
MARLLLQGCAADGREARLMPAAVTLPCQQSATTCSVVCGTAVWSLVAVVHHNPLDKFVLAAFQPTIPHPCPNPPHPTPCRQLVAAV